MIAEVVRLLIFQIFFIISVKLGNKKSKYLLKNTRVLLTIECFGANFETALTIFLLLENFCCVSVKNIFHKLSDRHSIHITLCKTFRSS